jgi:uncharacterized protein YkwD
MGSSGSLTKARRSWLLLEELEARQLLSGTPPTAVEQLFLEQLNDARANPAAYGQSIGLDLSSVAPSQPLAFDPMLIQAARGHSQDMNSNGYFAHNSLQGLDPGQRMTAAGFSWNGWGESIAGGSLYAMPQDALQALIVDQGVADLGHRKQLLAIDQLFKSQNQVGIGIVQGGAGPLTNYYTIDTASSTSGQVFITGVVFNDANGNGKYDLGEGLGQVTITVAGVGSTTSYDSGGYSIAVSPGTYVVTASGGGLAAPIVSSVTVGGQNYRLNFNANSSAPQAQTDYVTKLYRTLLGRGASGAEIASWDAVLQASGPGAVVSGIENSDEARTRLVKSWYVTYLGRQAGNGEEQGWVARLAQGASDEDVLAGILGSDEFVNRAQGLSTTPNPNENYIRALYAILLNRGAGQAEVNSWLAVLGGSGRDTVVRGILYSAEYRADVISNYYISLLHRSTAPAVREVDYWVNSGDNLAGIRMGFEGSTEFEVGG